MATSDTPIAEENYLPMLNPFAPGFFDNPYAQYAEVREQDPVHLTPLGSYACFRYADVHRLLRDTSLSVDQSNANLPQPELPPDLAALFEGQQNGDHTMLNLDPPDHHRLRRLVSKVFTPKMIEELRPRVQALVSEHLDAVVERGTGEMDLIADLAFPLPFIVISEMIGVPDTIDRDQLRDWSGALVKTFDPILTEDDMRAAYYASEGMLALIGELIDWKRANPADDLLSGMIAAEDDGDRLTEEELREQLLLIYIAGHETTVNLIGNGTLALLRQRDQLELVQRDEVGDAPWVDELLRFDSPVQMTRRITLTDLELGGKEIPAATMLMTALGAANRDPEKWGPTADQVDLRRADAPQHTSFGGGFHMCLGAHLARLEGAEAIGSLVRRFPDVELATDTLEWNGRIVLRGLSRLPLHVGV